MKVLFKFMKREQNFEFCAIAKEFELCVNVLNKRMEAY